MRSAAIIPVFNEGERSRAVVNDCQNHVDLVVVVDDGSSPDTASVLRSLQRKDRCVVLRHTRNRGKGASLRTGIAYLRKLKKAPDAVVFLDGDGEHDPREIPRFLHALESADLVLGERTAHRSTRRRALNAWMGAWCSLVHPAIRDPSCGLRAARWSLLKTLSLRSSDFCIDQEIALEAARAGATIASLPVLVVAREGSSVSAADYLRINNFFDRWVLEHAKSLKSGRATRILLMVGAASGLAMGTILLRLCGKGGAH